MDIKFVDLHEDFGISSTYSDIFSESEQSNFDDLKSFKDATIFAVVFAYTKTHIRKNPDSASNSLYQNLFYSPDYSSMIRQIKFYDRAERTNEGIIVRQKGDLEKQGLKMLLALEGTEVINDFEDIYFLKKNGVRSIGLAWNHDTKFAASCNSTKDYGLTGSGEKLVDLCNELHLAVDLGHASDQTIIDSAGRSGAPVIVSHTNPKTLHNVPRNIGDKAIEAVADNGGIIGITALPFTLGENSDLERMVKSMEYIGDNYGWEHVALGSDFLGTTKTPTGFGSVKDMESLSERLSSKAQMVLWKNAFRVLKEIL